MGFPSGLPKEQSLGDNRNKKLILVFFLAFLTPISHFLYLLYFSFWGHVSNYWPVPFFSLCFQKTPSMTGRTTCVPGASIFTDITRVRIKHDSYLSLSKQMVWSEIIQTPLFFIKCELSVGFFWLCFQCHPHFPFVSVKKLLKPFLSLMESWSTVKICTFYLLKLSYS